MAKTRIMLADDHTLFRQGIRTLISAESDMEVVGEAANGGDAVEKAAEARPDVVLMDIGMPGRSGPGHLPRWKLPEPAYAVAACGRFPVANQVRESLAALCNPYHSRTRGPQNAGRGQFG